MLFLLPSCWLHRSHPYLCIRSLTGIACISQLLFSFSTASGQTFSTGYRATRLRLLPNTSIYFPEALSEQGVTGGYSRIHPTQFPIDVAVTWDELGSPSRLPVTGTYVSAGVLGFLPDGTPVGNRTLPADSPDPGFFEADSFTELPNTGLGGSAISGNSDFIIGQTSHPTAVVGVSRSIATIWNNSGQHLISGLEGVSSTGQSGNGDGVYIGITYDFSASDAVYGGFIGRNGTATRLAFPGFPETRGFEINDDGWIAGSWETTGERARGYTFRYDLDTGAQEIHDLGLFPGYDQTIAYANNNDNTIVGGALGPIGEFAKALIWPAGSLTSLDLNLFVDIPNVTLLDAYRINNAGQILAEGLGPDGFSYYRLDPIPEPACLAMVVMAVAGSMNRPRRRL